MEASEPSQLSFGMYMTNIKTSPAQQTVNHNILLQTARNNITRKFDFLFADTAIISYKNH